jgi:hypothetical protein
LLKSRQLFVAGAGNRVHVRDSGVGDGQHKMRLSVISRL